MDNGGRALFMATSVLLAIMLISSMVYLFRAGASVNEQYDEQANNQLVLYNSKFEYYNVENNTIVDMISIANLAYNVNEDSNYDSGDAVEIEIQVGNTTFRIPNSNPPVGFGRNKILSGENVISTYDLASKKIGDLNVRGKDFNEDELLSKTHYNPEKKETIYNYLFRANSKEIKYNSVTGKIIYMKFEAYKNDKELEDEH